jgi:hypothetical protein
VTDALPERIRRAADRFPRAAQACQEILSKSAMMLHAQIEYLADRHGDAFWERAEWLVGLVADSGGNAADALLEYTIAYLREQARFVRSRQYSHADFEKVYREVYDNPEIMDRFYLAGLMLTHAFWPIHFEIHDFFQNEFLSRVPDAGTGVEYGFGHGLYLAEVLRHRPDTQAKGYDISRPSQEFASRLLGHCGVSESRFELGIADVREPLACPDGAYCWAIAAELLEHLPDPLSFLKELRRCITADAPVFLTTPVNTNSVDHLYLFSDAAEVTDLLRQAGYELVAELVRRVSDYGELKTTDPSVHLAYVCVPAVSPRPH